VTRSVRPVVLGAFLALVLLLPVGAAGQAAPLVLEVRGGAAVPFSAFANGDRVGEGVAAGPSLAVEFGLARSARSTLLLGFSQDRYGCENAGCASGESYVATGMNVGMRVNLRTTGSVIPWIGVVGRSVRVELPERGGRPAGTSDLGFGAEARAGIFIGAWGPVAVNPAIRVAALNTDLPGGDLLRMRSWTADLGFVLAF
jgi:hypothetical protein